MPTKGVVYIAYGDKARQEAAYSIDTLRESNPGLPYVICGDSPGADVSVMRSSKMTTKQLSRIAKTVLPSWSPYDHTLYLDADTRVYGDLSPIFAILRDGWEMVITPAQQHGDEWLWHVDAQEREYTAESIGFYAQVLQGGVFAFRRTESVELFFKYWQAAWYEYKGEDQGALIRALYASPVRLWLLGKPFNGGAVISHLFGRTREAK